MAVAGLVVCVAPFNEFCSSLVMSKMATSSWYARACLEGYGRGMTSDLTDRQWRSNTIDDRTSIIWVYDCFFVIDERWLKKLRKKGRNDRFRAVWRSRDARPYACYSLVMTGKSRQNLDKIKCNHWNITCATFLVDLIPQFCVEQ